MHDLHNYEVAEAKRLAKEEDTKRRQQEADTDTANRFREREAVEYNELLDKKQKELEDDAKYVRQAKQRKYNNDVALANRIAKTNIAYGNLGKQYLKKDLKNYDRKSNIVRNAATGAANVAIGAGTFAGANAIAKNVQNVTGRNLGIAGTVGAGIGAAATAGHFIKKGFDNHKRAKQERLGGMVRDEVNKVFDNEIQRVTQAKPKK